MVEWIQANTNKYFFKKGRFKIENEKRLEDALSDVKAELSELKMALNEITDRYDTYWNLNMTEAIKFYRGDTGNEVGEASCRFLF